MKFRFYITNLITGYVEGTDDAQVAEECVGCEALYVVDAETGEWITQHSRIEVRPISTGMDAR